MVQQAVNSITLTDVTDGYTVGVSPESYTCQGGTDGANPTSFTATITAFSGAILASFTIIQKDIVLPPGIIIASMTNSSITFMINNGFKDHGLITIPVHIKDLTINKTISVSMVISGKEGSKGDQGPKGDPGPTGISVQSVTTYYLSQKSTDTPPEKPINNDPGGGWTSIEPVYNFDNTVYTVNKTSFNNGTWLYSDVSVMSAYELAKKAYSTAANANKVENLIVGSTAVINQAVINKLSAQQITTGSIQTAASGIRSGINQNGFFAYNKDNKQTFGVDPETGNTVQVGTFATDIKKHPRIEISDYKGDADFGSGTIDFIVQTQSDLPDATIDATYGENATTLNFNLWQPGGSGARGTANMHLWANDATGDTSFGLTVQKVDIDHPQEFNVVLQDSLNPIYGFRLRKKSDQQYFAGMNVNVPYIIEHTANEFQMNSDKNGWIGAKGTLGLSGKNFQINSVLLPVLYDFAKENNQSTAIPNWSDMNIQVDNNNPKVINFSGGWPWINYSGWYLVWGEVETNYYGSDYVGIQLYNGSWRWQSWNSSPMDNPYNDGTFHIHTFGPTIIHLNKGNTLTIGTKGSINRGMKDQMHIMLLCPDLV